MTMYYRNVLVVEVLSARPLGDEVEDLDTLAYQITHGDCSGQIIRMVANETVEASRMVTLLELQGSDPTFLIPEDELPEEFER